jgi:hypothetical protein
MEEIGPANALEPSNYCTPYFQFLLQKEKGRDEVIARIEII